MGRSVMAMIVGFSLAGCAPGGGGGGGNDPGGLTPINDRSEVICEAPLCSQGRFALSATGHRRTADFRLESAEESLTQVRQAFASGDPGAMLLHALAATARPGVDVDPHYASWVEHAGVSFEGASWLASRLDEVVPGWETARPQVSPEPSPAVRLGPVSTAEYSLETSGCGEMALTMRLDSLTVVERVDNFTNDEVYCVVQARDDEQIELIATEVSRPLRAGDRVAYPNAVFYGTDGPRDPGAGVDIKYDCWEQDSPAEYEQFRDVIRAIATLGKLAPGPIATAVVAIAKAADLAVRIAAILDGDDHVFTKDESLNRRALWNVILERERDLVAAGTHLGSDYAWRLAVVADGCALGESAAGGGQDDGGDDPPRDDDEPTARCEDSCAGCCVNGRCDDGNNEQACGRGGDACRSCQGLDSCRGGRCVFDDRTRFNVVALRAEVDPYKTNGDCWDDIIGRCDDPPDVRVTLASGGQRQSTGVEKDWNPQWNDTVLEGVEARHLMDQIVVVLEDDDWPSADDLIGRCTPSIRQSHLLGGRTSFRCGQATSMVLEFRQR